MTRAFLFNKLVHDLIPQHIGEGDVVYQEYQMKGDQYIRRLCKNFHEEAEKLKRLGSGAGDMLREASDVFTTLNELTVVIGYLSTKLAGGNEHTSVEETTTQPQLVC